MTQTKINEGNRLIAESRFASDETKLDIIHYMTANNGAFLTDYIGRLKYHESYNMLMPVVEKIEAMGYCSDIRNALDDNTVHVCYFEETFTNKTIVYSDWLPSKIHAIYTAVIAFIHWLKTQEK